MLATAPLI